MTQDTVARLAEIRDRSGSQVDKPLPKKEVEMTPPLVDEKPKLPDPPPPLNEQEKVLKLRWILGRGVVADLILTGAKVTSDHIEILQKNADLLKEALRDDAPAKTGQLTVEHG
jgi:hypothetical protein